MPLVRAYIGNDIKNGELEDVKALDDFIGELLAVCREIVPAGMNSKMGPLAPGSIQFLPHVTARRGITVDVFLEIESYSLKDRKNVSKRTKKIKTALNKLFPELTFGIWVKLVKAGYASDSVDPEFEGDMSMSAAIGRARVAINPDIVFLNPEDDTADNRDIVRLFEERPYADKDGLTIEGDAKKLGLPPLKQTT